MELNKKIYPSDLLNRKTIFMHSIGKPNYAPNYEDSTWERHIIPGEYPLKNVEIHKIYEPIYYIDEYYITFNVGNIYEEFRYNIDKYTDEIEFNASYCFSTDIDEVEKDYIEQVKYILNRTWSGSNGVLECDVLKKHLYENEYDYFIKNYPELLV